MKEKTKFHIWNINALVEEFASETITEKERAYYYLAEITVFGLLILSASQTAPVPLLIDSLLTLGGTIVALSGIWWCFKANESGDNKNFVSRFVAINFVVSVRITVISLLAMIISTFILSFVAVIVNQYELFEAFAISSITNYIFMLIFMYLYFYYTRKHIMRIAHPANLAK